MVEKPILVGVTGGIGSGKTTACKIFEVLGFKVYYADDRGKALMETDAEVIRGVKNLFGEQAYVNSRLDRKAIGGKVFHNKQLLEKLNRIVHPALEMDFNRWVARYHKEPVLLKEAALLFETGSYHLLDYNILVIAEENMRVQRVLKRDAHRTENMVREIIGKQMTDNEKIPIADFVLKNDGNESMIKQVMVICRQQNIC